MSKQIGILKRKFVSRALWVINAFPVFSIFGVGLLLIDDYKHISCMLLYFKNIGKVPCTIVEPDRVTC